MSLDEHSTTPSSPAIPSQQDISPFFRLPRELRDNIYHYVFQHERFIYCAFPSQAPSTTPTHTFPIPGTLRDFQLRYRLPDTTSRNHSETSHIDYYGCMQTLWLLASKTLMHEAVAQFLRNCQWTRVGFGLMVQEPREKLKYPERRHWTTRLPVAAGKVNEMELYVENLANWGSPSHVDGVDSHEDLALIAQAIKNVNINLEKMTFVGHSYSFHEVIRNGQAGVMFRNLRDMFADVSILKFEFGMVDRRNSRYWVLYEWDEEVGVMRMLVHKRRVRVKCLDPPSEEDLANLLPPGWVLKRKVCGREECDGCYPADKETWRTFEIGS